MMGTNGEIQSAASEIRLSVEPVGARGETSRFAWTDAESGERLVVDARGDGAFLRGLESLGFDRLPSAADDAEAGGGAA